MNSKKEILYDEYGNPCEPAGWKATAVLFTIFLAGAAGCAIGIYYGIF